MRFVLTETHWILDSLYPGEWEWIRILPRLAGGDALRPESLERLYPSPLASEVLVDEDTFAQIEDWDELVRPELEDGFHRDREVVEEDLARSEMLSPEDYAEDDPVREELEEAGYPGDLPAMHRILVPYENTDAWYSTLNQARLLMNEEFRIADSDERQLVKTLGPSAVNEDRILLIAQYELYSVIQSILVENVMHP